MPAGGERLGRADRLTADEARSRQGDHAGVVFDVGDDRFDQCLEIGDVVGSDDAGTARGAVLLGDGAQFLEHDRSLALLGTEDLLELFDGGDELDLLGDEFVVGESGEAAESQLEDPLGLLIAERELLHQTFACLVGVRRGADDRHHEIDVVDRDEQALDDVEPFGGLAEPELRPLDDDVEAVVDVVLAELEEADRGRGAVDQYDVVDAEGLLEGRQLVELLEQEFGLDPGLGLDDQTESGLAVGQVLDIGDAVELAGVDEFLDLRDHALDADQVGEFGEHQSLTGTGDVDDLGGRPHPDRTTARLVDGAEVVVDGHAPGGEVGAGKDFHQLVDGGLRPPLGHDQLDGLVDLEQVVCRHVGGHAHGDAGGAVDQQVREQAREVGRFLGLAVVGGPERHRVFVDLGHEVDGGRGELALGVPLGCRRIVERAEVPLRIDQHDRLREILAEADQCVVDGGVAVRVELAHDVADDVGALAVRVLRDQPHAVHRVENATLDWLEAVSDVGDRSGGDDRQGVGEERLTELVGNGDIDHLAGEGNHSVVRGHVRLLPTASMSRGSDGSEPEPACVCIPWQSNHGRREVQTRAWPPGGSVRPRGVLVRHRGWRLFVGFVRFVTESGLERHEDVQKVSGVGGGARHRCAGRRG